MRHRIRYADDDKLGVGSLFRIRLPAILLGLALGIGLSFLTSRFQEVLEQNVEVAFFLPFIVYLADAIGTQTSSIHVRDLRTGRSGLGHYFKKETLLGLIFATGSTVVIAVVSQIWFGSADLTLAVSLGMFVAVAIAPLVALGVDELLAVEHTDPAAGAGPIATVIQDALSVTIFGLIASAVLL